MASERFESVSSTVANGGRDRDVIVTVDRRITHALGGGGRV